MGELARGSSPKPVDVTWETIVRFNAEYLRLEMRAMDTERVELYVRSWQDGGFTHERWHVMTFAELRKALDELERSAKEVERLG